MAIVGALALTGSQGLVFGVGGGFWAGLAGFGITAGAGIIDSQFLMPALLGDSNTSATARPAKFLQLPTMTSAPGSPRIWAYGTRLRVPAHVMFMTEKQRNTTVAGKGGSQARANVLKVWSDVAIALNDRSNRAIASLIGDGRLFYWTDRDLLSIRTSGMSCVASNTNFLTVTMASANEIDLSSRFAGRAQFPGASAPVATVSSVTTGTGTATITVNGSPGWTTNQWVDYVFVVTAGTRLGERARITANGSNTLTVQYQEYGSPYAGLTVAPQANDEYVIADRGDLVELRGWDTTSVNGLYQILYIRPHRLAGSSFALLEPILTRTGGTVTPATSGAGTLQSPASISRVDSGIAGRRKWRYVAYTVGSANLWRLDVGDRSIADINPQLSTGMTVTLYGITASAIPAKIKSIGTFGANSIIFEPPTGGGTIARPLATTQMLTNLAIFPTAEVNSPPDLYQGAPEYFDGSQVTKSSIITQHIEASEVPDFRGLSYIVFDEFSLTEFGNRVPNIEAVIDPSLYANWQEAFSFLCDRLGLAASSRNLSKIARDPFDGYYLRGAVPGVTALQPLMVAKEVVTQDRDGVLHFFPISQAEVVSIRNGTDYSDMGAATGNRTADSKFSVAQVEKTVLPSSVGVRHQDPDNFYADGYQHFGIRGPTGAGHENREEVDLSTLVLTRQAARNLAGAVLRRTWINSTTYEMELPASYWHLLENDVMSWTDDESIVHAARIIRIDRGTNWVIKITAVAEDINGAYIGSAVQSGAGQQLAFTDAPADITPLILDIPAVFDIETRAPGVYLGVAGPVGSEFRGCTIYESLDAGVSYNAIGSVSQQTTAGTTVDALDAYTSQSWTAGSATVTWDSVSDVQVQLDNGTLSTVTQAQVLTGENWALIGNEIVGFTTATLDGPGLYTLSGFLRNLRDQVAEPDIDADSHVAGERFVLLTRFEATGKFRTYPGPGNVGQAIRYKFVAPGQNIVDVAHQSLTLKARNALPFAPYASTLTWEANDDATITMTPWTNRNVAIGDAGPYTFDDTIEEYVVRIYTSNTYATETASSPITVTTRATGAARLRDRWVTYPKADVLSDGFTPGSSTIYYTVEQVGDYGTSRRKRFQG